MTFHVMHRDGRMEANPTGNWLDALLDELERLDDEHPDVAVSHETGWSLSAFPSGLVVWENVEDEHYQSRRAQLTRPDLRRAVEALSRGEIDLVARVVGT